MSDSTAARVRCQDCGFLSVRHLPTRQLVEVEADWRNSGGMPWHGEPLVVGQQPPEYREHYGEEPICFVAAQPITREYRQAFSELRRGEPQFDDFRKAFLKVVSCERQCGRFVEWQQGHSPREHKDMIDAGEQREWQEKRLTADRQRQQDLLAADQQHREELREKDREWERAQQEKQQRFNLKLVVVAGIFAILAGVVGAIVGAWLQAK